MVICLEQGADLHMAQLMPLPLNVSCFSKIQIGFTFLVPAHPGSPGQRAVKRVCVCVLSYVGLFQFYHSGKHLSEFYPQYGGESQLASTLRLCHPVYWPLTRVDDLPGRRTHRSTQLSNHLVVPPVKLSTIGSRAFAVAAPHIWNTLPTDVVAASSLSTFRRLLKRFLFKQSFPDIIY